MYALLEARPPKQAAGCHQEAMTRTLSVMLSGPTELARRSALSYSNLMPNPLSHIWYGQPKQPSKYERPLDTDMIGGRTRLPRGRHQLDKDPEFFRSVHLVGEGLAREKEEAKRRTEELWRSKVIDVVSNLVLPCDPVAIAL